MEITDKLLIECIRSNDPRKQDWALYQFYSDGGIRQYAANYIKGQGGKTEDVEDVVQEAMLVFNRNVREGRFEGKSSLKTYFISIVRWGWLTYRRKQDPLYELPPEQVLGTSQSVEQQYFSKEKTALLDRAIGTLGERCQQVLKFYKMGYSMQEIADAADFSSAAMAKKQAYRCRERLRKFFEENPEEGERMRE